MDNLLQKPITDKFFIKKLIPQKDPFVMVDSLFYVDEIHTVSGLRIAEENLLCGNAGFSEAGLIENMAQSVALHGGYHNFLSQNPAPPQKGFLGAIASLKIYKLPKIGSEIKTYVLMKHEIMGVKLSEITVKNEMGEMLAQATMKTVIIED